FGSPAMGQRIRGAQHPRPFDAVEKLGREAADLRIVPISAAVQYAAEQPRGIHAGELAAPDALPRMRVKKVVKESALAGRAILQEAEKPHDAVADHGAVQVSPLIG